MSMNVCDCSCWERFTEYSNPAVNLKSCSVSLVGKMCIRDRLGTSQGSVISPLLANIYLNTLDRLWEKYGHTHGILVRLSLIHI